MSALTSGWFFPVAAVVMVAAAVAVEVRTGVRAYGDLTYWGLAAAGMAVRAMAFVVAADTVTAAIDAGFAGFAGWMAWRAWKRRPPRDRRPARVLGRVRVAGGRLTVVPVGAP